MGAHLARRYVWDASVEPDPEKMPTFPPDYGFPGRKERGELSAQVRTQIPPNLAASLQRVESGRVGSRGRLTSLSVEAVQGWLKQKAGTRQQRRGRRDCPGALRPGHSAEPRDTSPYSVTCIWLCTIIQSRGWGGHVVHLSCLV